MVKWEDENARERARDTRRDRKKPKQSVEREEWNMQIKTDSQKEANCENKRTKWNNCGRKNVSQTRRHNKKKTNSIELCWVIGLSLPSHWQFHSFAWRRKEMNGFVKTDVWTLFEGVGVWEIVNKECNEKKGWERIQIPDRDRLKVNSTRARRAQNNRRENECEKIANECTLVVAPARCIRNNPPPANADANVCPSIQFLLFQIWWQQSGR